MGFNEAMEIMKENQKVLEAINTIRTMGVQQFKVDTVTVRPLKLVSARLPKTFTVCLDKGVILTEQYDNINGISQIEIGYRCPKFSIMDTNFIPIGHIVCVM